MPPGGILRHYCLQAPPGGPFHKRHLAAHSLSQDRLKANLSLSQDRLNANRFGSNNWMHACVPNRVPNQYFLPIQTDLSSVVLPEIKYSICRITCNSIPTICHITCNQIVSLSYYLQ